MQLIKSFILPSKEVVIAIKRYIKKEYGIHADEINKGIDNHVHDFVPYTIKIKEELNNPKC